MRELVQITRFRKSSYQQMILALDERKRKNVIESQLPLTKLSKYLSERLVTDKTLPVPDCLTCGACCVFPLIVPVTLNESERLNECWEILLDDADKEIAIDRTLPRDIESGRCINLSGSVGGKAECGIYEQRPSACRSFEAGSDRCHAYRRMYGLEPQLTEDEVLSAVQKLEMLTQSGKINDVVIMQDNGVFKTAFSSEAIEEYLESLHLKIMATLDDETQHELHSYNSTEEVWFENELLGCTLDEAREMIASRNAV